MPGAKPVWRIVREKIGSTARLVLGPRWCRRLRRPALLPAYYRRFTEEVEHAMDLSSDVHALDEDYWAAILRKHAHIIDKGLQCDECEPGHAMDHFAEAQRALKELKSEAALRDASVVWARAVLDRFRNLQCSDRRPELRPTASIPEAASDVLQACIRGRRSVRRFQDRSVEVDRIRTVVEAACWAPQSCNRQTIRVFATREPSLVNQCMRCCRGATRFSARVPSFLSYCADLRPYFLPAEMTMPEIDVALGVQNSCLVAHASGLGITLLSWCQSSAQDEATLRSLLRIPAHYRIVVNAVMGYYDLVGDPPARKATDSACVVVS